MSSYLPTDNELTYQQLLQQLQDLNNKIDVFVNGSESTLVPVGSGTIKTLAGIQKAALTNRYVQNIIDMKTRQDILDNISFYSVGNLFRVWGEIDSKFNGIYKIDNSTTILKVSYSDIYDLRDILPSPWNYDVIDFDETISNQEFLLATIQQPFQNIKFVLNEFNIDYSFMVDTNSQYTSYHSVDNLSVKASSRGSDEYFVDINQLGSYSVNHFYSDLKYPSKPTINVTHLLEGETHIFKVYLIPPKDETGVNIAGHGQIRIKNIDTKSVSITKYLI